jgi:hypothetical protein
MNEIITTPVISTPVKTGATNTETYEYLVYYFFGFLEILLAFRLILKIAGASLTSGFVRLVYTLTGVFTMPFEGIFRRGVAPGIEATSVFEPATVVALIVYILIAWGIVKLVRISSGEQQE